MSATASTAASTIADATTAAVASVASVASVAAASAASATSFTITVQLPTGDHFVCPVRAFQGKARFPLHAKKIIEMAYRRIGITQKEYRLAVLFGDEEEILTTIFQRIQPPYSPEELQRCVARSIQTCNCWAWCEMERERIFTRDTTVHILSIMRPKP